MQRSPLQHIIHIISGIIIGGVIMVGVAYAAAAIGSTLNGWRTAGVQEDITDNTGTCKRITAGPANYFIPSRTATEWNAFNTVAASKGFTITSCGQTTYTTSNTCPSPSDTSLCWNVLSNTCPVGTTIVGATASCMYPGTSPGGWIGATIVSQGYSGNGYQVDCQASQGIGSWQDRDYGGANLSITCQGINGVCGATANTCTAGTPSGFVDNHCGVTKTWNCLGSGGGSNIACTKTSNSCVYPTASNVNWAYGAWDVLYASCPAGTHIITGVGTPYYPGYGSCMGDYINIGTAVWPGSSVQWGNGWTVDFFTFGANAGPTYHGVYSYDYYYGNGYVATDAWCGGGTLTLTCEYD